jgi:hypothetical protein
MMRRLGPAIGPAIAVILGWSLAAIATASAQQPRADSWWAAQPAPEVYIPPWVWNGNALDQKILDAQAQMVPLRHPIRHFRHHRHN